MRLCRFDGNRFGIVRGASVHDVTPVVEGLGKQAYPFPRYDLLVANLETLRPQLEAAAAAAAPVPLDGLRLNAPVANPSKLIGAPVNYLLHLEEAQADRGINFDQQVAQINTIGLFLKATSALTGPGNPVCLRFGDRRNDHEVELAVIIGRRADRVTARDALGHVAGYAIGLDMTVRGTEDRSMRKSVDSYAVLGPWLATADEVGDPGNLDLSLAVNGEVRQSASTSELVLPIPELIEFASRFYTLEPGDVIFSGTPAGVGPVTPGDKMTAWVEKIGEMKVGVEAA